MRNREVLPNERPLLYYGIEDNDTLQLVIQNENKSFTIYVKDLAGEKMTLFVKPSYTAEDFKLMIQGRQGIPPGQQGLIFAGKQLQDGRALGSYNVQERCTINLVFRLTGG